MQLQATNMKNIDINHAIFFLFLLFFANTLQNRPTNTLQNCLENLINSKFCRLARSDRSRIAWEPTRKWRSSSASVKVSIKSIALSLLKNFIPPESFFLLWRKIYIPITPYAAFESGQSFAGLRCTSLHPELLSEYPKDNSMRRESLLPRIAPSRFDQIGKSVRTRSKRSWWCTGGSLKENWKLWLKVLKDFLTRKCWEVESRWNKDCWGLTGESRNEAHGRLSPSSRTHGRNLHEFQSKPLQDKSVKIAIKFKKPGNHPLKAVAHLSLHRVKSIFNLTKSCLQCQAYHHREQLHVVPPECVRQVHDFHKKAEG